MAKNITLPYALEGLFHQILIVHQFCVVCQKQIHLVFPFFPFTNTSKHLWIPQRVKKFFFGHRDKSYILRAFIFQLSFIFSSPVCLSVPPAQQTNREQMRGACLSPLNRDLKENHFFSFSSTDRTSEQLLGNRHIRRVHKQTHWTACVHQHDDATSVSDSHWKDQVYKICWLVLFLSFHFAVLRNRCSLMTRNNVNSEGRLLLATEETKSQQKQNSRIRDCVDT